MLMLKHSRESVETIFSISGSRPRGGVGSPDLFSERGGHSVAEHDVYRSSAELSGLPSVIVLSSLDAEDFFATVATYYPDVTPVTAFCHVLPAELSSLTDDAKGRTKTRRRRSVAPNFRAVAVGAIIGEAMLANALGQSSGVGRVTFEACRGTLAFALFRSTIVYGEQVPPSLIAERWTRIRSLGGDAIAQRVSTPATAIHQLAVAGSSEFPLEPFDVALRDYLSGDDVRTLPQSLGSLYPIQAQVAALSGPFDDRMSAYIKLVQAIRDNPVAPLQDDVAVAFFCNQIFPGSFAHGAAITELYRGTMWSVIWYGIFASLSGPVSNARIRPSLSIKIERDLFEAFSIEDRPRCDIGIDEFEVLMRARIRDDVLLQASSRGLRFGIIPGVELFSASGARIAKESDDEASTVKGMASGVTDNSRLIALLEEALSTARGEGKGLRPPIRKPRF